MLMGDAVLSKIILFTHLAWLTQSLASHRLLFSLFNSIWNLKKVPFIIPCSFFFCHHMKDRRIKKYNVVVIEPSCSASIRFNPYTMALELLPRYFLVRLVKNLPI